jgi:N-acetylgalactosamine 4-sulfate 6-O-sulfotransferase
VHALRRYTKLHGSDASGELSWANESIRAFSRCEAEFGPTACALWFESLTRENEETFYHCDQLIKGIYAVFLPEWRREFARLLPLRTEEYFVAPQAVLARAFRFLRLRVPQTQEEWRPILGRGRMVHGSRPSGGKPPLPQNVRDLLRRFYLPWQRILAGQLAAEEDAADWREWAEAREDAVFPRRHGDLGGGRGL